MQINIYIIEDNLVFKKKIKPMIKEIENYNGFIFNIMIIENIRLFIENISNMVIEDNDLFLLDIDLNMYHTGLDIGEMLRKRSPNCFLIYLTSFENRAIDTINRSIYPTAYIVKKFDEEMKNEVKNMLEITMHTIQDRSIKEEYVVLKEGNIDFKIATSKIMYLSTFQGGRKLVYLKTLSEEMIVAGTLKELKEKIFFDLPKFYTGNRTYIINTDNLISWSREDEEIELIDGETIYFGKKSIDKLKKYLLEIK